MSEKLGLIFVSITLLGGLIGEILINYGKVIHNRKNGSLNCYRKPPPVFLQAVNFSVLIPFVVMFTFPLPARWSWKTLIFILVIVI